MSTITLLKNDLVQMKALRYLLAVTFADDTHQHLTAIADLDERIASVERDLEIYTVPSDLTKRDGKSCGKP